jgi:hypothetical protein
MGGVFKFVCEIYFSVLFYFIFVIRWPVSVIKKKIDVRFYFFYFSIFFHEIWERSWLVPIKRKKTLLVTIPIIKQVKISVNMSYQMRKVL